LIAIPTLLIISLVVFTVLAFAPGDPLSNLAGSSDIPIEVRENIRRQFGLDQPVYVRYVKWLVAYLQGDWGYSFGSRIPASTLISLRIPTTLWVIGLSYLIAVVIAIPLGVLTAVRQYTVFDHFFTGLSFVGFSLPTFFTGVLLIIVFSVLKPLTKGLIAAAKAAPLRQGALAVAGGPGGGPPEAPAIAYEQQVAQARGLVAADPKRGAQVVKQWVSNDE
jgi:ABC-type dipeptide/oligopeptide/nickel transport system permease component